jgi:hypothetical protein
MASEPCEAVIWSSRVVTVVDVKTVKVKVKSRAAKADKTANDKEDNILLLQDVSITFEKETSAEVFELNKDDTDAVLY